jgi:hypothetical protein
MAEQGRTRVRVAVEFSGIAEVWVDVDSIVLSGHDDEDHELRVAAEDEVESQLRKFGQRSTLYNVFTEVNTSHIEGEE